jgi:hypothetical protein
MRYLCAFIFILLVGCNDTDNKGKQEQLPAEDSVVETVEIIDTTETVSTPAADKVYANERFKDVMVKRNGGSSFTISGKGQLFEAGYSWVVEDGHSEIAKGFGSTDAGAPEWGKFSFTIDVPKPDPHATLHLILFEISAKDGSRQYELPVPLY